MAERLLGDDPDKVRVGLDVLGERTLVWVRSTVYYASDVVSDFRTARDGLTNLDHDAREVATKDTVQLSELIVDVCKRRQGKKRGTEECQAIVRLKSVGFNAIATFFTRISSSAMLGTGCSLTETLPFYRRGSVPKSCRGLLR